jgi:succinate-semialdehyde dehydrogenase / glutarate-semialdehyde dehydrogenase
MCSDGLKKVTLELGGNCPFLIFDDANLQQAADALMGLKWRNSGQVCITANRVFVQSGVYDKFADIIKSRTAQLILGHGRDSKTTIGPVTTPQSLDRVLDQVNDARANGAKILLGGERDTSSQGFFMQPTIIGDATNKMKLSREESFAPVLALFKFDTEAEAVELANDTPVRRILHRCLLPTRADKSRWAWPRISLPKTLTEHGDFQMSWRLA